MAILGATADKISLLPYLANLRCDLNEKLLAFSLRELDVDAQGGVFWRLLPFLLYLLAGRGIYVLSSGVPLRTCDENVLQTIVVFVGIVAASLVTQRFKLIEATLLFRGGAMFSAALLWSTSMCVFVLHTGRHFPFADDGLASLDRTLGFSWADYARWIDGKPILWELSKLAYTSIGFQFLAVFVALAFMRSATRLYTYVFAQTFSLTACAIVAIFVPSIGAYAQAGGAHLGLAHFDLITADKMTSSILWLRSESFGPGGVEGVGLISFPSYHTVCAVLFVWAFWSVPVVRWVGLVLNLGMIASTPLQGSHYLVDLIAGASIAVLSLMSGKALISWVSSNAVPGATHSVLETGRLFTSPSGAIAPTKS